MTYFHIRHHSDCERRFLKKNSFGANKEMNIMEGNLVCNLLENMLATLQKPLSKDKVTPVNVRVSRDGEGYLASVE